MIALVWGAEGTCKTTLALTWPKPIFHMELDIGGFERAAWRLPKELRIRQCEVDEAVKDTAWGDWDIVTKPYPIPVQMDKLVGAEHVGVTVRFPRRMVGYRELWERIVVDYVELCRAPIKTLIIDSATKMWEICHRAHLQDKQEIQIASGVPETDKDFREKLIPVEFPNEKMHSLIYTAKSFGKHLILTHYPTDEYKETRGDKGVTSYKTGNIIPDGFKKTKEAATIIIWTYLDKENIPRAKIDDNPLAKKCAVPGLGTTAIGLELPEPSYEGLEQLRDLLQGG